MQDRTNVSGIITNKRAIESTVVVDDGLIVVIGGLIEDRVDNVVDQVPVLGDIVHGEAQCFESLRGFVTGKREVGESEERH